MWFLQYEGQLIRKRINHMIQTNAIMMQAAMSASQSKKAFKPFQKLLGLFK